MSTRVPAHCTYLTTNSHWDLSPYLDVFHGSGSRSLCVEPYRYNTTSFVQSLSLQRCLSYFHSVMMSYSGLMYSQRSTTATAHAGDTMTVPRVYEEFPTREKLHYNEIAEQLERTTSTTILSNGRSDFDEPSLPPLEDHDTGSLWVSPSPTLHPKARCQPHQVRLRTSDSA